MERPLGCLAYSVLLLSVAVSPLVTSVQAESHHQANRPVEQGHFQTTAAGQADGERTPAVETDSVLLEVDVAANGSAQWRIEYRTRIDDAATEAEFRRLQRDLRTDPAATGDGFDDRIRRSVAAAEDATGREMAVSDFAVDTSVRRIPRTYGVVSYSFRWRGFATVSDRGIRVGDALEGFFLGTDERLVVSWPSGYELDEARPTPDTHRDGAVVWRGPQTFGPDGPRVDLVDSPWPGTRVLPLVAVAVALSLVAVLAWARRHDAGPLPALSAGLFGDSDGSTEADRESELLSNEERVVRLLEDRGGRVRQQEVADEFGWTRTKTSYVVSNLREDGRIHSFRLGRENVLSLSDAQDVHQRGT